MTDPVISPDGKWIYTGDKWIEIKDESGNVISKSDVEENKIKVKVKPRYPIFRRKKLYLIFGLSFILLGIDSLVNYATTLEDSMPSFLGIVLGFLLTNVKYCSNSTNAIIYYLHQGPQKYDELKNKLNISEYKFDSILDRLREHREISYIYTTKKADRLILLGDN
tara:strand:+ start:118 stop:612 length:495 start_codon:yes stop_codon:yes gene_type:complete